MVCASDVVRRELDKIKADALQAIDNMLQLEHDPLFTQNTDFYDSEKRNWSLNYTRIRRNPSKYLIHNNASEPESDDDQDEMRSKDDKFQKALSTMVDVRAYFQVTYKVTFPQSRAAKLRHWFYLACYRLYSSGHRARTSSKCMA